MALHETEAIVLRTYNLGEADKIVVCLTHSAGLIRGVAKGCRKLKSRFGAALEPFTLTKINYHQKENAEILTGLAYMGDLVIEFSPPYQPNERLFRMVKACLEAICESQSDLQIILRYFEVWLLRLEGFFPDVRHCGECHRPFNEKEPAFMNADLMFRCSQCSHCARPSGWRPLYLRRNHER